ncbi:MAG: 4'-phosphopantetheinyl transferase superfamily protein [Thiohalocapsa sp.]|jgi:4'-phosphopantetheinyl transferase
MQKVTLHIAYGAGTLAELAAGAALLDADEQARAARFRRETDRMLYCAAHVLLRQALSQQAEPAPAAWRFVQSARGRPEIDAGICPGSPGLRFNLTHTPGLVCCALTRQLPVGVDAECRRGLRDARALAQRFFAADEAAAIAAAGLAGSAAEALTFQSIWTLKEAYVKALGLGLSMGLDRFAFRLTGGAPAQIRLHQGPDAAHPAAHWRCVLLHLDGGRCTLAAAVPAPKGARFRVLLHGGDAVPEPMLAGATAETVLLPAQRIGPPSEGL